MHLGRGTPRAGAAAVGGGVGAHLVPDELQLGDQVALLVRLRGVFVHGGDEVADVGALGGGAGEGVVCGPGVPRRGRMGQLAEEVGRKGVFG